MPVHVQRPAPVDEVRGVFDADPLYPPLAPSDARAIKVRDSTGRIVSYSWIVAEYFDERLYDKAWVFLEAADPVTPLSGPRLLP